MSRSPDEEAEYLLERYVLGELPPEDLQALESRIESDASLRRRVEELRRSNRELLKRYPPAWFGRQVRLRSEPPAARVHRDWGKATSTWLLPAAAVAIVALLVTEVFRSEPPPETRIKGMEPRLQLFRRTAAQAEQLTDSTLVRSGTVIQIVYHAAGESYGVILSVDGRGTQTLHVPESGQRAAALAAGGPDTLAYAYRLDDAPAWERFYLVTADIPFDIAVVRRAVEQGAVERGIHLALPAGFKQDVFTLLKEPQP